MIPCRDRRISSRAGSLVRSSLGLWGNLNGADSFRGRGMRIVIGRVPWMGREIGEIFDGQIDQRLFHRLAVAQCLHSEMVGFILMSARQKIHERAEIKGRRTG